MGRQLIELPVDHDLVVATAAALAVDEPGFELVEELSVLDSHQQLWIDSRTGEIIGSTTWRVTQQGRKRVCFWNLDDELVHAVELS